MLVKANRALLGDGTLDENESLARLKEKNRAAAAQNKIPDQDVLEDKAAALGYPMQPNDLVNRLEKINPAILFEKGGVRNCVAVRIPVKDALGNIGKKYITGFYVDQPLPEFSAVVVDKRGLPIREIRGWRSVLLALVKAGALTKKQVKFSFGLPNGSRAVLWEKQLQGRN